MPPDRNPAGLNALLSGGLDRNMPRFSAGETLRVAGNTGNVTLAAFLALVVLPLVLIRETPVDPALLTLAGPLVWVAARSGWEYHRFSVA